MDTQPKAPNNRLSGQDAAFLYLERKEIPLHIAGVLFFDAPIPFEEFVAAIDSKLHLVPRYMQIVVDPPFDIGYPSWQDDPQFDIRRHIFHEQLEAPGSEAELEALAGRIFSPVMDRSKPLWDIHIVDGLNDGRGAIILRIHHSLADGVSGIALLKILLDPTPEGSHSIRKPQRHLPSSPRPSHSLADAITNAARSAIENLIASEEGLLDLAQGLADDRTQQALSGLTDFWPELATPAQRLPFNKPCGGERLFCWTEIDFEPVRAIKAAMGATVNDVILTILTHALASYVKLHGESVEGRLLRVICPVNVRHNDNGESLGNQITFLPVVLPMSEPDPLRMLQQIAPRTAVMKNARAAELVSIATHWLGSVPTPLQMAFWRTLPLIPLPVPLFNIICTNVMGSPEPLYSVGRRLTACYPHVPTGYELGVGCAVQSYNGKLFFGLTADAQAAADVGRLRDLLQVSFAKLCRSAAGKAGTGQAPPPEPRKKSRARKPRAARRVSAEPAIQAPLEAPISETHLEVEMPAAPLEFEIVEEPVAV